MTDLATIYNLAPEPIRRELLGKLGNPWYLQARPEQLVPRHSGVHSIMAGRGWGRTRSGAEWIVDMAARNPGAYIAVVGRTEADAYNYMVEGDSGIFTVSARYGKDVPTYDASAGQLYWKNGSKAFVRGMNSTDPLRGYNHQFAWLDLSEADSSEDRRIEETWQNLTDGSRLGDNPQILVTTSKVTNWLNTLILDKRSSGNPYWTLVES